MAKAINAATAADAQFSMNGESKEVPFLQQEANQVLHYAEQDAVTEAKEFVVFKLVDNTKQGGVHIDGIDDALNPETGKVERMRLLAGISSIWLRDQKDCTPDYVKANQRSLVFPRGARILRIAKDDNALEFATRCRHNIGNPKRKTGSKFEFYEYNPKKQQEAALALEMLEIEQAIVASKVEEGPMRKHALFLGINPFDDLGIPKGEDGIRREYIIAAKRNPTRFKNTLNSKEVEVAYLIRKAITDSLIDLGGHSGQVTWSAGGRITNIPIGRNTQEYLIELALNTTSHEGRQFFEQLQKIIT
jgi:hypothetical protein